MTLRSKQRLSLMVLIALAIWPLAQRGLVARYNITPWKFMGFAMYCLPKIAPVVQVHAHYGDRRSTVNLNETHMRDVRRELARFETFRQVWGELLSPDRLGEATSKVLTRADKIEIVVTEGYLDPDTWRLAARETIYPYLVTPRAATPLESDLEKRVRAAERRSRRRGNPPP